MGRNAFPPTLRKDDYPSIGLSRGGYILVCHGDDRPTEWADWLTDFVASFGKITSLAEEHGVRLSDSQGGYAPSSLFEFCEAIGIEMDGSPWNGCLISGTYWLGWLRVGTLRATKSRARSLIASMSKQMELDVRAAIMRDLSAIRDLDALLERTDTDRPRLQQEITCLKEALQQLRAETQQKDLKVKESLEQDTHAIDQACLAVACAILGRRPTRLVAGPILLWEDGIVYAIVARGGVPVPAESSPRKLIDTLVAANHPVVQVREKTVIGGWTSGPIYRKGAASINGWATVWTDQERVARKFEGDHPGDAERAHELHRQLAASRH
jgi:hypothetical protein